MQRSVSFSPSKTHTLIDFFTLHTNGILSIEKIIFSAIESYLPTHNKQYLINSPYFLGPSSYQRKLKIDRINGLERSLEKRLKRTFWIIGFDTYPSILNFESFIPLPHFGVRVKYCRICHKFFHRDVMAGENIANVARSMLVGGSRPAYLTRPTSENFQKL